MKMSLRSKVVIYALLVMVAIYFLSPFVYMLFSTFKTSAEAIAYPPSLFPKEWQWENYAKAWDAQPFGKYLLNSVIVTVLNTLGTVLSCSLVAYGFARYNFKGKNILFSLVLIQMMSGHDEDGASHAVIALRLVVWNEDGEAGENDLLNLLGLLRRAVLACRQNPLDEKYVLEPDERGNFAAWVRPDEQPPHFLEAYVLTNWKMQGFE